MLSGPIAKLIHFLDKKLDGKTSFSVHFSLIIYRSNSLIFNSLQNKLKEFDNVDLECLIFSPNILRK